MRRFEHNPPLLHPPYKNPQTAKEISANLRYWETELSKIKERQRPFKYAICLSPEWQQEYDTNEVAIKYIEKQIRKIS